MEKTLKINDLRLGYGNEEVLRIDNLELEPNKITGLLGPSGGGKSSLLNGILRQALSPSYWEKGELYLEGRPLDAQLAKKNISFVPQKARLYTDTLLANFLDGFKFKEGLSDEMKRGLIIKIFKSLGVWYIFEDKLDELAIKQSMGIHKVLLLVKAVARKPKLLLIDEVLANTSVKDEAIIINLIKEIKKYTTVLLITHNKEEARDLCDSIALVSGGILHEHTACDQFFEKPQSDIGMSFLETGSAWYTNPNNEDRRREDNLTAFRRFSSMCEFYWVKSDILGGMQKPGLMTELEEDLTIMRQLGVNVLVTLQQNPIDVEILELYGIEGLHFPIVDMSIPTVEETYSFLESVQPLFDEGKSLVYHCKAGMGRTGTLLACQLVWLDKTSAIQAIEHIQRTNHKYIQTEEQIEFVGEFEKYIASL